MRSLPRAAVGSLPRCAAPGSVRPAPRPGSLRPPGLRRCRAWPASPRWPQAPSCAADSDTFCAAAAFSSASSRSAAASFSASSASRRLCSTVAEIFSTSPVNASLRRRVLPASSAFFPAGLSRLPAAPQCPSSSVSMPFLSSVVSDRLTVACSYSASQPALTCRLVTADCRY